MGQADGLLPMSEFVGRTADGPFCFDETSGDSVRLVSPFRRRMLARTYWSGADSYSTHYGVNRRRNKHWDAAVRNERISKRLHRGS